MTLRESGFQQIFTVKSGILVFDIQNTNQGILNPTNDRNQESKFHSKRIRNSVPGIRNPEFKSVLDSLKAWFSYDMAAGTAWDTVPI